MQSGVTKKAANNDLRPKQIQSNATSGVLQVAGPSAAATRVMTTPNADFTVARTDAAQTFTGDQTLGTGNLVIGTSGKGIDFSVTSQAGGMTSELFSDYEEGTFTPVITGSSSNPTVTYGLQRGNYVKAGKLVLASVYVDWSALSGGGGNVEVNLPFTAGAITYESGTVGYISGVTLPVARVSLAAQVQAVTAKVNFPASATAVASSNLQISGLGSAGTLNFTVCYRSDV